MKTVERQAASRVVRRDVNVLRERKHHAEKTSDDQAQPAVNSRLGHYIKQSRGPPAEGTANNNYGKKNYSNNKNNNG